MDFIFDVRENLNDFTFINNYVDQDFVDRYKLFVAGKRPNIERGVWEYYVKSRKAGDYRQMILNSLYHPPFIKVDAEKSKGGTLYLNHRFEEKPLVKEFIANTLLGVGYLWGGPVKLETTELVQDQRAEKRYLYGSTAKSQDEEIRRTPRRVVYSVDRQKLVKTVL
jgi:stage V sporulation protein R